MKIISFLLFLLFSISVSAQVEISNLDMVIIGEQPETQHINLDVLNSSNDSIDLEWEVEKIGEANIFLDVFVSDINLDYTPAVSTTCDLMYIENVLAAGESYLMGLHFKVNEVPADFDKDSILAYFYFFKADQCEGDTLLSLPIRFDTTLGSTNITENKTLNIFPNPATNILQIEFDRTSQDEYFEIFDFQMKLVMKGPILNTGIDVSGLKPAAYFIRVNKLTKIFILEN